MALKLGANMDYQVKVVQDPHAAHSTPLPKNIILRCPAASPPASCRQDDPLPVRAVAREERELTHPTLPAR